ncbi:hypothetical protein V1517DRAFT_320953 [Lipomyces orientalis]|uniref:Uncharacterized protein n=1 Tax=Lipomyces orientalis TaxID=1233043 RepID=A0ACC3TQC8_9ASCO
MAESTPSSTHSQVHALLDIYQSLASRYHPSSVNFELEVYNDADPLPADGTPTELVSSPLDRATAESRIVQSIRSPDASVNSSRRPVAVLYANITPTESPGNGVSFLPPLLSYAEMRAILAGHSDEEEYTRYQSESSELDPQHTADSEIFLTTRSKLLYGDHQRDATFHTLEIPEKAPQLELPKFDELSIEDLLDSVIADHDNHDKRSGNSSEAGQLSASSNRSSLFGNVDFSNVTPRSRFRQRALKLRRRSASNFSPMIDRTVRTSPWYSAVVRSFTEVDYDQIHPDISWSVHYRFKQVLRELSEKFRLQQLKNNYQDVFISSENAHWALQLGNSDAVTPTEELGDNLPHTPVRMGAFRNGMQPCVGKLQLSRMTQYRYTNGSPAVEREQLSITAIPPSDKRPVNSNARIVPRNQTDPAVADDQRTDTFSSIHAENGHTADLLKAYNRRRLTWGKISGKSTSKRSFRKFLTRPMKVPSVPTTPLSQLGSFMTTEYVRSSESIGGRNHKEKKATFASPVKLLLGKLHVREQLKAAAKGAHIFGR